MIWRVSSLERVLLSFFEESGPFGAGFEQVQGRVGDVVELDCFAFEPSIGYRLS